MSVYSLTKIHMSINPQGFRSTETCHKVKKEHPGNFAVYENTSGSGRDIEGSHVMCIEKEQIGVVRRQAQYCNYVSCFVWIVNDDSIDLPASRDRLKKELSLMLQEVNDQINQMNAIYLGVLNTLDK